MMLPGLKSFVIFPVWNALLLIFFFFFFCLKTSLNLTLSLAFLQRLQAEEWTFYSVIIPVGAVPEFLYGELQGAIHLKGKESGDRQEDLP